MLEFKDVSVSLGDDRQSRPFSLVIGDGQAGCLCGEAGSGKTAVLLAVLGLWPIAGGYITIDGELVSPGSAPYFRKGIAYLPQLLPEKRFFDGDLVGELAALRVNKANIVEHPNDDGHDVRLALLETLPSLKKKIVLIDDITADNEPAKALDATIKRLCADGAVVLYTCRDDILGCANTVNISK